MRALIVNGDDFGLTPGVNAGILECHVRGILTSASLFANGRATDEAVLMARRTPTLGVGCHLALVDAVPILPAVQLPTLAPGGTFRSSWRSFITSALAGHIHLREVERELEAQIEHLRGFGLVLTHLDAHKHVHAYPPVFEIVVRLARRFTIPSVRVPCEMPAIRALFRPPETRGTFRRAIENLALLPWARRDCRLLIRQGYPPPARLLGRALTGQLTSTNLRMVLNGVRPGISELMTHPGYPDAALSRITTRLRATRAIEVALLTASETREVIGRRGIVLVRHDRQFKQESHVA
jgi:predicted glycoside hydrolase/deacetylase ChbG (UPF0249 family)